MSIMEDLQEKDRDIKTKLTEAKKSYTIIPHPPIKLWLPIVKYTPIKNQTPNQLKLDVINANPNQRWIHCKGEGKQNRKEYTTFIVY